MAPDPDYEYDPINILHRNQALFEDSHMTAPSEVDAQHPGILSSFGCIVGLKNQGKILVTFTKMLNDGGMFLGFMISTTPLPVEFEALWCRIFFRHDRELVLVMDVNRQDFIIYDVETGYDEGHWTLFEPLPDGSMLMSVQTIDDDSLFSLTYIVNDNSISVECWYPGVIPDAVA